MGRSVLSLSLLCAALGLPALREARSDEPPVSSALERVETLDRLLGRPKAENAEVVAAIDAVVEAYAALAPPTAETTRFRRAAEARLLDALEAVDVVHGTKRNRRHAVQVHAARALANVDPRVVPRLLDALRRRILGNQDYQRDPAFYETVFATLTRLMGPGAFDWLLAEAVNADVNPDSQRIATAAIREMAAMPGVSGRQRHAAVRRLLSIFQSYAFHWANKYDAVAGFRSASPRFSFVAGTSTPYWTEMQPVLLVALRRLATDPRTGRPPVDESTGGEVETIPRYMVWSAQHARPGAPPWLEPESEPPPRRGPQGPGRTVQPLLGTFAREYGAPWMDFWQRERPARGARPDPGDAVADAFRTKLRTTLLPSVVAEALASPTPEVRAVAALTEARLAGPSAYARLEALLAADPSERVREAAVLGLFLLQADGLVERLRALVLDPAENPRVRGYAVLALGVHGDRTWLVERFLGPRSTVVAEPAVREDLEACAVRAVGLDASPSPGTALAVLLSSILASRERAPAVRSAAATALASRGGPAPLAASLRLLRNARPDDAEAVDQVSAAVALRSSAAGSEKALSAIRTYLEGSRGQFGGVRGRLALAVASIGGPDAEALLVERYEDTRKDTTRYAERGWFLTALGRHGGARGQSVLHRELRTLDHEQDRGACAVGLAWAGARFALPEIADALGRSRADMVPASLAAVGALGTADAAPAVREVVDRLSGREVIREGALALASLRGAGATPDLVRLWSRAKAADEHDAVATAFATAAGPEALAFLTGVLRDERRPAVERAFALAAIGRMVEVGESVLDRFSRDVNPYACSPTLAGLARWRDVPFLE